MEVLFSARVMSLYVHNTQALRDNNLVTCQKLHILWLGNSVELRLRMYVTTPSK